MYTKTIYPRHESKTESKTVPHELIRLNNNGQGYHEFPHYRPIEAVSKPTEKEVLGSSSPPFEIHKILYRLNSERAIAIFMIASDHATGVTGAASESWCVLVRACASWW
jgi:hypothetical protein